MNRTLARRIATLLVAALVATACAGGPGGTAAQRERAATAEKMFAERCKKSGVFIHRTAENVEGIFLMKLRGDRINYGGQYLMDDPYGRDVGAEAYLRSFLRGNPNIQDMTARGAQPRLGYHYVDAIDPKDGQRYRYTGSVKVVGKADTSAPGVKLALQVNPNHDLNIYAFTLDKVPAPGPLPRYGVTYDDLSTREERDYWIAGSSLRVIDLQTDEVMAERIGYMMDRGQGSTGGGRSPWLFAADNACPTFGPGQGAFSQTHQTEKFVHNVLNPLPGK